MTSSGHLHNSVVSAVGLFPSLLPECNAGAQQYRLGEDYMKPDSVLGTLDTLQYTQ